MIKLFLGTLLSATFIASAWGASGPVTVTGKVKSFDKKSVIIVKDGKLLEFDIKRVKDKSKLKVGSDLEVTLN